MVLLISTKPLFFWRFSSGKAIYINTPFSQLAEICENKVFTLKMYREFKIYDIHWLMIKLSLNQFVLQTSRAMSPPKSTNGW